MKAALSRQSWRGTATPDHEMFTPNPTSNFTTKAFMPRMGYEGHEERQKELVLSFVLFRQLLPALLYLLHPCSRVPSW
jgi:hypothetical protein